MCICVCVRVNLVSRPLDARMALGTRLRARASAFAHFAYFFMCSEVHACVLYTSVDNFVRILPACVK